MFFNTTAKELCASIPDKDFIKTMMSEGIRMGSTQLAVSAMQELIQRGEVCEVHEILVCQEYDGNLKLDSSMASMIGRILTEQPDPILKRAGQMLINGEPFVKEADETRKLVTKSDVEKSFEEAKYYVENRERITAENAAKAKK